jgi:hypothetical protein
MRYRRHAGTPVAAPKTAQARSLPLWKSDDFFGL